MRVGTLVSNKRIAMVVAVLVAIAAGAPAQSSGCTYARCALPEPSADRTPGPPIFRQVSFPPFAPITLGEPLPQRAPPTVPIDERRAAFAHPFGDADSIFVEWDAGKRVRLLEFLYPSTKSARDAVDAYEALIGADEQHTVADSAGQRLERWSWKDQATMFEVSSLSVDKKPTRVWSILRDRASPDARTASLRVNEMYR